MEIGQVVDCIKFEVLDRPSEKQFWASDGHCCLQTSHAGVRDAWNKLVGLMKCVGQHLDGGSESPHDLPVRMIRRMS